MSDGLQYGLSSEPRRRSGLGKGSQTGHWEVGGGILWFFSLNAQVEFKGPMTQDSSQKT